jgi:hypothetical protein
MEVIEVMVVEGEVAPVLGVAVTFEGAEGLYEAHLRERRWRRG